MNIRETFEEREFQTLSSYASHSRNSRGRERYEPECDIRTVYQRDRDRILHSKAFRRLKDKTQVFLSPQGDHYRTRLTHTLEVSQTARTVARALKLNEDLVEAIALGHDLGHTPFGHAGEAALNAVHPGGFKHAEQSVRVVEVLEKDGQGLNLTWEVRDGILNHRTAGNPSTLEGQVVRLCDKISYIHRERLNTLIHDIVESSYGQDCIRQSPNMAEAMKLLRELMFANVYRSPVAKKEEVKVKRMLTELYEYYTEHPEQLSGEYRRLIEQGEEKGQVVCDYISGMTDQYSIHKFEEIFVPKSWAVY